MLIKKKKIQTISIRKLKKKTKFNVCMKISELHILPVIDHFILLNQSKKSWIFLFLFLS